MSDGRMHQGKVTKITCTHKWEEKENCWRGWFGVVADNTITPDYYDPFFKSIDELKQHIINRAKEQYK